MTTRLFHTLKKTIQSGKEKTVDSAYDSARLDFLRLHEQVLAIRTAVSSYSTALRTLFASSKAVCDGFADTLEDAPKPHPYQSLLSSVRRTRGDLVSDRGEGTLQLQLGATVEKKLADELELHKALLARIATREELRAEAEYYTTKLDELRGEREKRLAKGKEDSPKDIEKFERNVAKQADISANFHSFNAALSSDLVERYAQRTNVLGPTLQEFMGVEKAVLVLYATAVRDAPQQQQGDAGSNGSSNGASDAAAAAAAQAKRDAARQASLSATDFSAAAASSATPHLSAGQGMLSSAFGGNEEHKSNGYPPHAQHQGSLGGYGSPASSVSSSSSSGSSASPPAAAAAASSRASVAAWDAPPMLSAIASSGLSVNDAVSFANMNTDGSAAVGDDDPFFPSAKSPVQPVFYGSGGNSSSSSSGSSSSSSAKPPPPPGGPPPHPSLSGSLGPHPPSSGPAPPPPPPVLPTMRPRVCSFGSQQQRGEGQSGEGIASPPMPPSQLAGRGPPPPPPGALKQPYNPFDEE